MSELTKKYGKPDDKACNTEDTERRRKHPRSDEECSRHVSMEDINQNQHNVPKPEEKDSNEYVPIRYIPDLKNKHKRDQFEAIKKGMKFSGVIDGSFPGGYFITIGVGNSPTLSGVAMLNSDQPAQIERNVNENVPFIPTKIGLTPENQNEKNNYLRNTGNPDPCIDINKDKIPHRLKVGDELVPEYSTSKMLCSHEVQIPYKPVVLKPVNPIGVPIIQTNSLDKGKHISKEYYSAPTGCRINIDPFLHRNVTASALSITPPSDQVVTSSFRGKSPTAEQHKRYVQTSGGVSHLNQNTYITTAEQFARVKHKSTCVVQEHKSSLYQNTSQHVLSKNIETRNFLQHQLDSQTQVLATNLKDKSLRVPGNNILVDDQQFDHAQPNSSFPTSKKSKHMQDNN